MNVFILTDLEGIAGIDSIEQMARGTEEFKASCVKLCESINLSVNTCITNGAENVYYLDGHGGGGNVFEELIDKRAVKCSLTEWQELIRSGKIDCQIEIGAHARAGTIDGFLDHTLSSKQYFCIKINGREMSELSVHAIFCAKYGVPVVAVTGDETVCKQAKEYIPNIYTGAVKNATCRNIAKTYTNANEILINTIETALKNYKNVEMIKFAEPIVVEQTFYRTDMCEDMLKIHPNAERVDARTLRKNVNEIKNYHDLKF